MPSGYWADAAAYAAYTLNRTPSADEKSPFALRYGKEPKIAHLRPFGNPCVVYRSRSEEGKVEDAGVKGVVIGYGYVKRRKGYRVRITGTNQVVTTVDVGFSAFPRKANEVNVMPAENENEAPAVKIEEPIITTPVEPEEVSAIQNAPVAEVTTAEPAEGTPVITTPSNANNFGNGNYLIGAKVVANWRGHGTYYPALVTEVHPAGVNGNRTTYDLVYEVDGEPEAGVGTDRIRTRSSSNIAVGKPCGHALVTDCNPAYLADVPDLAREHVTPRTYKQAKNGRDGSKWTKSMEEELDSLRKQGVYAFVSHLPSGEVALRCLWVYKVKCGPDGKITRYKSRLTVNGKTQRFGIDYTKTFSPVAFATSIRLLFALGIANKFHFRQYDIKCAFLYAKLPKEQQVYMHTPPGSGRKGYWLLLKSLYGLRQAPMLFNEHLDKTLRDLKFVSCEFDPCLYRHSQTGSYLVVVVDDMILAASCEEFCKHFYRQLAKVYDVKDLGEPRYVIGVRVKFNKGNVSFMQDRYIDDLHGQHNPGTKPTNTPAAAGQTLCATGIHGAGESPLLPDPKVYRSLVGGLMYALITRPDVAAAVSMCARYLQQPRQVHLEAAKRVLRYLHHTRTKELVYMQSKGKLKVVCFVDSSWGNDVDTRRSRFGFAIYVGRCLVAWTSKLHAALSLSTAEAEYTAATEATKTLKWIVSLMEFMKVKVELPIAMYEDNSACRSMVQSPQVSGRNKHFELRQHYVRQQVKAGLVVLKEVSTAEQIADIFTKALARPLFEKHAAALMYVPQGFDYFPNAAPTEGGS